MSEEHESFIKTPKQLIITVVLSFAVPILVAVLASQFVTFGRKAPDQEAAERLARLILPVAKVEIGAVGDAAGAAKTGEQIYTASCAACHGSGAAGAPKLGDKAAWGTRIATGLDALVKSALGGKGAMPPKGGNAALGEADIARAVAYMANQAGASFTEPVGAPSAPAAPAASAAAPPPAAAAAPVPDTAPKATAKDEPKVAAAPAGKSGEQVYQSACVACHGSGAAGAPKLGDKAAWAPRLKQGLAGLMKSALGGKGAMPPKGGNAALSDDEIARAIVHMANQSGGNLKEPAGAAAAGGAPAEAARADKAPAAPAPTAAAGGKSGEQVYQSACAACHGSGAAGAPKLGDKAAWAPRLKQGLNGLMKSALGGKGAMPPKGGNPALSEAEIARAIVFMANQAGGSLKEPGTTAAAEPKTQEAAKAQDAAAAAAAARAAAEAKAAAEARAAQEAATAAALKQEAAARAARLAAGKAVYDRVCTACHAAGVGGAPKTGDTAAWGPRIVSGSDALLASALNGKGAMPPRGGNPNLSDAEVKSAVEYMMGQFR